MPVSQTHDQAFASNYTPYFRHLPRHMGTLQRINGPVRGAAQRHAVLWCCT